MRIKTFRSLRPPQALASQVASLPYDVVDAEEARELTEGNPMSFLHVVRPEVDLPRGTGTYDDAVYSKAAENLKHFRDNGYLAPDDEPALYLYRITSGTHAQTGLVTVCHVDDYDNDIIKKHEKTRRKTEDDRTRHVSTLSAHPGPIFLTYRGDPVIDTTIEGLITGDPLYAFTAPDGVKHEIWRTTDSKLVDLFAEVPCSYVADGHHRAASAARVAHDRRTANATHTGGEEYNWFLTVLFPGSQLKILPYNRCVEDLNGMTHEAFLDAVRKVVEVTEGADATPTAPAHASMYLAGTWYGLRWPAPDSDDAVANLDVSVLQDRLLNAVLGIDDPRENPRIAFVGGIRGTEALERRVQDGRAAVAFSMYPTTVEQLMSVADAGQVMPPKSTWFEPKLRSGLIVHPF